VESETGREIKDYYKILVALAMATFVRGSESVNCRDRLHSFSCAVLIRKRVEIVNLQNLALREHASAPTLALKGTK
jgi:hypothetical protein